MLIEHQKILTTVRWGIQLFIIFCLIVGGPLKQGWAVNIYVFLITLMLLSYLYKVHVKDNVCRYFIWCFLLNMFICIGLGWWIMVLFWIVIILSWGICANKLLKQNS